MEPRTNNWIEQAIGKRWSWAPNFMGYRHGRKYYNIIWEDGTEGDYFIDWFNRTIEPAE